MATSTGLVQLIATGFPSAVSLITNYLSSPVIGGEALDPSLNSSLVNDLIGQQLTGGILIEAESYREVYASDIATQLLINLKTGNEYITDNKAIQPTVWEISGYLPAKLYEISALYMPSLKTSKKKLIQYAKSRQPVKFKTAENEIRMVLIENLVIDRRHDAVNKVPISLQLREVNYLTSDTPDPKVPTPSIGSLLGDSSGVGSTPTSLNSVWAESQSVLRR